jgi:hypothetical protein
MLQGPGDFLKPSTNTIHGCMRRAVDELVNEGSLLALLAPHLDMSADVQGVDDAGAQAETDLSG